MTADRHDPRPAPRLALLSDVPPAVTAFVIPNLLSNIWQGWRCRAHRLPWRFAWVFAGGGAAGSAVGAWMLARALAVTWASCRSAPRLAWTALRRAWRPGGQGA